MMTVTWNIWETVQIETSLLQTTNVSTVYQIAAILMTLSNLRGHLSIASILKSDFFM